MRADVILAGVIIAVAIVAVRLIDREDMAPAPESYMASAGPASNSPTFSSTSYAALTGWAEEVRISAARDNQYYIDAQVNRRDAHFLVDTGASYVAMRDSDARAAGVYTEWTDYSYPVRTANGETKAAFVTLEEVEIGAIRLQNVQAFILPDDQLSVNLLGMSFLSRLDSVEARAGELVLRG